MVFVDNFKVFDDFVVDGFAEDECLSELDALVEVFLSLCRVMVAMLDREVVFEEDTGIMETLVEVAGCCLEVDLSVEWSLLLCFVEETALSVGATFDEDIVVCDSWTGLLTSCLEVDFIVE